MVKGLSSLFNEKSLTQLVSTDKRFHGPVTPEKVLDFSILVDPLRRTNDRGGHHLQGIRIHHAVTLEAFRLLAMEHCENHTARPQQFCQTGHYLLYQSLLDIIEQIPEKHGVEEAARVFQILFHKPSPPPPRTHLHRFPHR